MKRSLIALAAVIGAVIFVGQAYAHHSFTATYHDDQTQKIEGNVIQFLLRNPHSFLHVEAKDDKGVMQKWAIEWGGGVQLNSQGVTKNSLKAGDHVIITGNPSRNPEDHRLRMKTLLRPSDGFSWGGRSNEVVD